MRHIREYEGTFLNHLEGMYRAEDREAAVALAEALGLAVVEMRFTENSRPLLAGHFNPEDRDPTNNVVFLYEMPDILRRTVDLLERKIGEDEELGQAMAAYRQAAAAMPPIMPHFGVRYGTEDELKAVMVRLTESLAPEVAARVSLFEVPAYEPVPGLPDIRQVFVRTDILTIGTTAFEQAIELQAERGS